MDWLNWVLSYLFQCLTQVISATELNSKEKDVGQSLGSAKKDLGNKMFRGAQKTYLTM
jgi:hypothetical protein